MTVHDATDPSAPAVIISAGTIDREISVLRAAIKRHAQRHPSAPCPTIYSVHLPEYEARWLTKAEAARLLAAAISPHVYLFMLLMLATAARPEALFDLTWSQVDFRSARLRLNPQGRIQNAKRRPTLPIQPQLMEALRAAYATRTCDYVIEYGGAPINSIKRAFREAAARAGFAPGDVTPYSLRHTAATWMAQDAVPLWDIAGYLGHVDTRMVERTYAHHHPDFREKPAKSLGGSLAAIGAADNPMMVRLKTRDVAKTTARREGRRQRRRQSEAAGEQNLAEGSHNPLKDMVGAAGIEPATPTMST